MRSLSAEKSKDFISDRNEKANTKIIILYLLLLLFGIFLIWIVWNYQVSNFSVSDEWVVESTGEQTFSVSSERTNIYAIGLCNDNTAIDAHVEYGDYSISGTALIKDENNDVVWQKTFTKLSIPTLSIEKLDDFLEETIVLEEGKTYIPILLDENGENISGITWSFYGKDRNVVRGFGHTGG